jgi:hypothetical protein
MSESLKSVRKHAAVARSSSGKNIKHNLKGRTDLRRSSCGMNKKSGQWAGKTWSTVSILRRSSSRNRRERLSKPSPRFLLL